MEDNDISEKDILQAVELKLGTNDFSILHHSLDPVEEKVGLLGDHAFLNVSVFNNPQAEQQHLSFFVKLFPKSEAVATFAMGAGAFEREEFIYEIFTEFRRQGINIIDNCTGRCYVANPNKYVILDNLSEKGFNMPETIEYLDYSSILVVLHSVAQLHASSLIFEERMSENKNEKYRILDGNELKLRETLYNDGEDFTNKNAIDATFKCILSEIKLFEFPETLESGRNFLETTEEIYSKIFKLVKPSEKHRNVLCHGDLWSSNFMLKSDKNGKVNSCKIVDFQSVRYVPPAHDVLSLIYLTTSREFRQQHMYEIIGIYYSYLEKFIKLAGYQINNIISFSQFMDSCEEQKLFAVLLAVGILPLILSDRDSVENIYCDKELYQKVFREDRSILVFNNENNEQFMTRIKESVEDLKEECEKFKQK